jgi:hypothetical protein
MPQHCSEWRASAARRATLLVAPDDPWWPEAHTARAARMLRAEALVHSPDMMHAFCVSPELSELAADHVHRWSHSALDRHRNKAKPAASAAGASNSLIGMQRRCELPLRTARY